MSLQHNNEVEDVAESRKIPVTYGNSDDEDLVSSGDIEGSAGELDVESHINAENQPPNAVGPASECPALLLSVICTR